MDGAAVGHMLPIRESKTFAEYAKDTKYDIHPTCVFGTDKNPTRGYRLECVYTKESLTLSTRADRGTGARKRVSGHATLPGNWTNFLRNDDNKDELVQFLGQECVSKDT